MPTGQGWRQTREAAQRRDESSREARIFTCLLMPLESGSLAAAAAEAKPPGGMPVLLAMSAMPWVTLNRPVLLSVELSPSLVLIVLISRRCGAQLLCPGARRELCCSSHRHRRDTIEDDDRVPTVVPHPSA